MIEFRYPWFFLLYIPFIALILYSMKRGEPAIVIPSIKPFRESIKGKHLSILSKIPFFLFCIAMILFIFSLTRPQYGIEETKQRVEGIDIILAIDLSGSMKAIDVPTDFRTYQELQRALEKGTIRERVEIAKDEIKKFVEKRPNDRIGLIAFAPMPYFACPPTLDHNFLYKRLEQFQAGMIGDSTGIAGPIASAVERLKNSEAKRKVIVLFTDGKNNVDARITPRQAAQLAKKFNIILYTVGIGTPNAYIIQDGIFGRQLVPLAHEFDEKILKEMAEITGGYYYAAKDAKGLEKTMNEINKLEKTTMEQPKFVNYRDIAFPFINAGIILLLISFFLGNTFLLKIP